MPNVRIEHLWAALRPPVERCDSSPEAGLALLWIDRDVVVPARQGDLSLSAGDLILADRAWLQGLDDAGDWSAQGLYIEKRQIQDFVGRHKLPDVIRLGRDDRLAEVLRQLRLVGDRLSQAEPIDETIGTALVDLITRVSIRLVANATEDRAPVHIVDTVDRAMALIRAHLSDHRFGVAALALRMRVSPRQLSASFAALGTTTARAILETRIERGKTLLADPVNTHRQIADIALACGFEDQNYFTRCFRTMVGQTPRAFRKNKHIPAVFIA